MDADAFPKGRFKKSADWPADSKPFDDRPYSGIRITDMSEKGTISDSTKAAYAAAAALKPGGKVELIDRLIQEIPSHHLQGLSKVSRQKIIETPLDLAVRHEKLEKAVAIMDSAKLTPDFFFVKIPEGVSDFEAIDSMNCLFRERFPSLNRDAVDQMDLPTLLKLPSVVDRDVSKPRKIPIYFLVEGTRNKSFAEQKAILDIQGMVPAEPIEQLLTAMAYALLHPGNDPFKNQLARGSLPNLALFNTGSHGLRIMTLGEGRCPIASMSALPAIVN